jgi:hypothetical protein
MEANQVPCTHDDGENTNKASEGDLGELQLHLGLGFENVNDNESAFSAYKLGQHHFKKHLHFIEAQELLLKKALPDFVLTEYKLQEARVAMRRCMLAIVAAKRAAVPIDPGSVPSLSVKEIKRLLDERGVSWAGCIEKSELVQKLVSAL